MCSCNHGLSHSPLSLPQLDGLDLATPPDQSSPYDPLGNAAEEISVLASCMNEEKRDSESRRRLVQWQARIRGKFPSPLVQPHRKLLHDGNLVLTRIVRRETEYHEVSLPIIEDGDNTITGGGKTLVAIDRLGPSEPTRTPLVAILTSDLLVLCKTDGSPDARERGTVDLFAVLRMQTKTQPASFVAGTSESSPFSLWSCNWRRVLMVLRPQSSASSTIVRSCTSRLRVSMTSMLGRTVRAFVLLRPWSPPLT